MVVLVFAGIGILLFVVLRKKAKKRGTTKASNSKGDHKKGGKPSSKLDVSLGTSTRGTSTISLKSGQGQRSHSSGASAAGKSAAKTGSKIDSKSGRSSVK